MQMQNIKKYISAQSSTLISKATQNAYFVKTPISTKNFRKGYVSKTDLSPQVYEMTWPLF